ncbi:hypothetical protein SAMN05660653_00470 [Desulfonatronum thiosulfatophilum]|uniref:Uncharacterized protein n=1 Tax=Desulfonatronum thiosulfatophilum TaxID=617002 RepID=A0A1G6ALM7_9BACT|nr:hypothetical protein SAMN05660653_00470 [Desulfonatronum thiosulfatophilum]
MSVTSGPEVVVPVLAYFIGFILYDQFQFFQLPLGKTMIDRQLNYRLKPEFRFPVRASDVYMSPRLLSGEKEESVLPEDKNGWAHLVTDFVAPCLYPISTNNPTCSLKASINRSISGSWRGMRSQ